VFWVVFAYPSVFEKGDRMLLRASGGQQLRYQVKRAWFGWEEPAMAMFFRPVAGASGKARGGGLL
jgi:hypothetical protein